MKTGLSLTSIGDYEKAQGDQGKPYLQGSKSLSAKKHLPLLDPNESILDAPLTPELKKIAQVVIQDLQICVFGVLKEKTAAVLQEVVPYAHQRHAVNKFIQNPQNNIILAHGTGTGKTLSALMSVEEGRKIGKTNKALVVVPASLRNNFLENNIQKFTNSKGVIYGNKQEVDAGTHLSLDTPDPDATYHIVSSEIFRKDPIKWISATKADTVIYDELHRAKDEHGLTYEAIKKVRPFHKSFIGLTGSVISNDPSDIVPLVDAMTNGQHSLGTRTTFKKNFLATDPKTGKRAFKNLGSLVRAIIPHVDYFGSDQMKTSDMPKKQTEEIYVEMSPYQHGLFSYVFKQLDPEIVQKLRRDISSLSEKEISHVFSKIINARKVSNSIHTLDDRMTPEQSAFATPKTRRLLEDVEQHLKETPDGHAVLFTNLIHGGVDVLKAGLTAKNIPYGVFIGKGNQGVTEKIRQQAAEEFRSGKSKALIISSAGGEGLSLPNTTMFATLDGHYNPERILQAEARGVRAGGLAHRAQDQRKVIIRRYITIPPRGQQTASRGFWGFLSSLLSSAPPKQGFQVPSTDEWMYAIAKRKHFLNKELHEELKKTGAAIMSAPPSSLREQYWDMFGGLWDKPSQAQDKKITLQEQLFVAGIRNAAQAVSLNQNMREWLEAALSANPGDPKILLLLTLIFHKAQELPGIPAHLAEKMIPMSDTALRNLLRGNLSPPKPLSVIKSPSKHRGENNEVVQ